MTIKDIAVKAAKNTAAAAYMPVKAGVEAGKSIGHQVIDPYTPSSIMRQFKYHSGLAIIEKLFDQSKTSLFGKPKTEERKEPTVDGKPSNKIQEEILFEVKNSNSILGKVTAILEATHELTRSIFGLELKTANENKNKNFANLEDKREGKNFNVGMMGIGGVANAANGNTPAVNNGGSSVLGDVATGIGAGIGGRIAIGALAGTIGTAIMGAIKNIFNVRGLMQAFSKTGLIGRIIGMIGGGLMAGVASIFSLGKLLPLLTKLAWPATIVASIGMGIMDGWNKYMETGDLSAAIQTGLTSSLDFLTFGLFSAIKDAASSWLTGGNIVNLEDSNAKVDLARDQLIKGEITQGQYDEAMTIHEEEVKKWNEFMAPVNNDIAREQLGMPDLMTPPVIESFGNSGDMFSPTPNFFDPTQMPMGLPVPDGSGAGTGDKPPLTIIIEGSGADDPYRVEQDGKVLFDTGTNPIYKDTVTAPNVLPPTPSGPGAVVVNNNTSVNNSTGGGGDKQYRHSPISTTPNHQSKWERSWLTSD